MSISPSQLRQKRWVSTVFRPIVCKLLRPLYAPL